jgi:hypothetical protein
MKDLCTVGELKQALAHVTHKSDLEKGFAVMGCGLTMPYPDAIELQWNEDTCVLQVTRLADDTGATP